MDTSPELAAALPARPSVSGRARPEVSVPAAGAVICAVLATAGLIVWNAFDPDQLFTPFSWTMPATFAAMGSLIVAPAAQHRRLARAAIRMRNSVNNELR